MKCTECAYISFKVAKKCPLCNAKLTVGNTWSPRTGEGFTLSPLHENVTAAGAPSNVITEPEVSSQDIDAPIEGFESEAFSESLPNMTETEGTPEEELTNGVVDFALDLEDAETLADDDGGLVVEPEVSSHSNDTVDKDGNNDSSDEFEVEGLGFEDEFEDGLGDGEINLDELMTPKESLAQTEEEADTSIEEEPDFSELSLNLEEESALGESGLEKEDPSEIVLDIGDDDQEISSFQSEVELNEAPKEPLVEEPLLQIDPEFSEGQDDPDFIDLDNLDGETPKAAESTTDEDLDLQIDLSQKGQEPQVDLIAEADIPEIEIELDLEPDEPEPEGELEIDLEIEPDAEADIPPNINFVEDSQSSETVPDEDEVIMDPVAEVEDMELTDQAAENSKTGGSPLGEDFEFEMETEEDSLQKNAIEEKPVAPVIEPLEFELELEPDQSAPLKTLDTDDDEVEIEDLGLKLEDSDDEAPSPPAV